MNELASQATQLEVLELEHEPRHVGSQSLCFSAYCCTGRHATDSEIATSTGSTKLFSTVDGVSMYEEIDPSKTAVLNLWVEIPLGLNGPFTRVT